MKKELNNIKFNLTEDMFSLLFSYNNLKNEYNKLKNSKKCDEKTSLKIKDIESKLDEIRNNFIKEFRKGNKAEIDNYLKNKSQNKF